MKIQFVSLVLFFFVNAVAQNINDAVWIKHSGIDEKDYHVAFRGTISLDQGADVELNLLASSWFVLWVNGEYTAEGPSRYHIDYPEYQTHTIRLSKGKNTIAVQVHQEGVETRMMKVIPPFLWCEAKIDGKKIPMNRKVMRLTGYLSQFRLISNQFGWVEWLDTRQIPANWQQFDFDDSKWETPESFTPQIGEIKPLSTANVQYFTIKPKVTGTGKFTEQFGYELDNISARFFLRDLQTKDNPPQGVWIRYDLGRVRLMRPKFTLDLPAGAVVEFAYSERLINDRVVPWIALSLSDSYNMDHFVARGGVQEFFPLTPKGGRFVEMHIIASPEQIKVVDETFIERCYYDDAVGSLRTNDELLNRIWQAGVDTYKACAEDALTDNPTRERGQWLGDVAVVGVEIGASAFSDVSLIGRGLMQSAQCALPGGMVAGLCPGNIAAVSSFALQWISGCMNYWRITGDRKVLENLFDAASKNLDYMLANSAADGLTDKAGWAFIDWGYVRNRGAVDIALNLHYLAALRDMVKWCEAIGKTSETAKYRQHEREIAQIVKTWFDNCRINGRYDFEVIGYQRTVLGLINGIFEPSIEKDAIEYMKSHILNCFPNNDEAPRLSDPGSANPQLITTYFSHFALALLIEKGEIDFVLNQYRKCWGWALEGGRTTLVEVFDTRWTHAHQWSGCPTWQLSRYVLGLKNRFDTGKYVFDLRLETGNLTEAEGKIPITGTNKVIGIKWKKEGDVVTYRLQTDIPVIVNIPKDKRYSKSGIVKVKDELILKVKN